MCTSPAGAISRRPRTRSACAAAPDTRTSRAASRRSAPGRPGIPGVADSDARESRAAPSSARAPHRSSGHAASPPTDGGRAPLPASRARTLGRSPRSATGPDPPPPAEPPRRSSCSTAGHAGRRRRARRGDSRSRLGLDHARVPGPDRGQRDRRHGGNPSPPHHTEVILRGDQSSAGPCRTGHGRRKSAVRAVGGRHGSADIGVVIHDHRLSTDRRRATVAL